MKGPEGFQYQFRQRGKIRLMRDGSIIIDSYIKSYIPRAKPRASNFWRVHVLSENDILERKRRRENKKLKRKGVKSRLELTPMKLWKQQIILTREELI